MITGLLEIRLRIPYEKLTILMKETEEKWLLEKFGDDYEKYCKKANRIIPWFRRR